MGTKHLSTKRPRAFQPIHDRDGQTITPIRGEDGRIEYQMQIGGLAIGYAKTPGQAISRLAETVRTQSRALACDLADEAADADALLDEAGAVLLRDDTDAAFLLGCAVDEPLPFEVCHE